MSIFFEGCQKPDKYMPQVVFIMRQAPESQMLPKSLRACHRMKDRMDCWP